MLKSHLFLLKNFVHNFRWQLLQHTGRRMVQHRLLSRQITSTAVVSSSTASPSRVSSASTMSGFPDTKSKKSLVAKYVTEPPWNKLRKEEIKTSGFTLSKAIACAVQFDNQHCGSRSTTASPPAPSTPATWMLSPPVSELVALSMDLDFLLGSLRIRGSGWRA